MTDAPGFSTLQLHAGAHDSEVDPSAAPIYQTVAYQFRNAQHAADLFAHEKEGNIYTRMGNPTQQVLEERVNALEGGAGALALASGQAAVSHSVLNLVSRGSEIISSSHLYGGTYNLFRHTLPRFGVEVHFVPPNDPEAIRARINDRTRAVFAETVANPAGTVLDFESVAGVCSEHSVPFIVDNTLATPYLCRPLSHGADIVVHSATKFIGGHGTSMGGVVVDGGTFDWTSARFPEFSEPDQSNRDIRYALDAGDVAYIARMRSQLLRDLGACISPFNAFLLLQGLETLSLRMERHVENARKLTHFLQDHPRVRNVHYPGLPNHPHRVLADRYLPRGPGSVFSFEITGGHAAAVDFIDSLRLFSHLANLGDARSLVIHPASTTHAQLSEEDMRRSGVTPELIRISVGLENLEDLKADLSRALERG